MIGARKAGKRFTLLLLEEGEDYVADWVASCTWPNDVSGNWQQAATLPGRLRLCTKSLFFDADDARVPIARLPFAQVQGLAALSSSSLTLTTSQVTKMRKDMMDAPYVVEKGQLSTWVFELTYSQVDRLMPLAHEQLAASRLPYGERQGALQAAVAARTAAAAFDTSQLIDFSERIMFEAPAQQLRPLVREPGRLAITQSRIYFQPLHNVAGDTPVRSHPLASVAAVASRRSALRPVGIELFFVEDKQGPRGTGWGAPSAFFALLSVADAQQAVQTMRKQEALGAALPGGAASAATSGSILEADSRWLNMVTAAWQGGKISNLDYLLYCNLAAGRSFNDLSQWPVFPWVIADYGSTQLDLSNPASFRDLTKPVGALNPQRLAMFKERYREMPRETGLPPPFLYGTHYSCPGYVMYWLVRAAPAHLLRLQNGRFDAPDRMFFSIAEAWESVNRNPTDLKELIPEFFLGNGSFLINQDHLPLGMRQNGKSLDDVELPPWAASPADFIFKHRQALESPAVSANLHQWLDLIFGYKQRGQAAVDADNVFHHVTYEGGVDIDSLPVAHERAALEQQVNEFGQAPKQLFRKPHPLRLVCPDAAGLRHSPAAGEVAAVSMALLVTIQAAAEADADAPHQARDERLNFLEQPASQHTGVTVAAEEAEGSHSSLPDASPAADKKTYIAASEGQLQARLRGLSGRLGSHLTAVMDGIRGEVASDPSSSSAVSPSGGSRASLSGLRSLFARPASDQAGTSAASIASAQAMSHGSSAAQPSRPSSNAGPVAAAAADDNDRPASSRPSAQLLPRSVLSFSSHQTIINQHQIAAAEGPSGSSAAAGTAAAAAAAAARVKGIDSPRQTRESSNMAGAQPATMDSFLSCNYDLCQKLPAVLQAVTVQQGAVSAVLAASVRGQPVAYAVGHGASLRVVNLKTNNKVLSVQLGSVPLTSLAALPLSAAEPEAGHPLLLAGSFDSHVYVHSLNQVSQSGAFQAHDDAVSCVSLPSPELLLTGSWDCCIKAWRVEEGRHPWTSIGPHVPQSVCTEADASIWALAAVPAYATAGELVLAGTEEGTVFSWDMRSRAIAWKAALCSEYISGLAVLRSGQHVVASAADGSMRLLDFRMAGRIQSTAHCAAPLQCCISDGMTMLAGGDDGQIHHWDLAHEFGQRPASQMLAGYDDLHGAWPTGQESALHCLWLGSVSDESILPRQNNVHIIAGSEAGTILHCPIKAWSD